MDKDPVESELERMRAAQAPVGESPLPKIPAGIDKARSARAMKSRKNDDDIVVGRRVEHKRTASGERAEVSARFEIDLQAEGIIPVWERRIDREKNTPPSMQCTAECPEPEINPEK